MDCRKDDARIVCQYGSKSCDWNIVATLVGSLEKEFLWPLPRESGVRKSAVAFRTQLNEMLLAAFPAPTSKRQSEKNKHYVCLDFNFTARALQIMTRNQVNIVLDCHRTHMARAKATLGI
jgi:hypothetical protein